MNKTILILLWALILSAITPLCAKEIYRASLIPELPTPAEIGAGRDSSRHPVINGSTLIYTDQNISLSGILTSSVYAYNIEQRTARLLLSFSNDPRSFGGVPRQVSFGSTGSRAFLILEGRLIVTDGSVAGTTILGDFGIGFCCFVGTAFNLATAFTTIDNIFYFSVTDTESTTGGDVRTQSTLWRSDGTVSGTFPISPASLGVSRPFKQVLFGAEFGAESGSKSLFYFASVMENNISITGLFRIGSSGETELFQGLDGSANSLTLVSTSRGSFFCGRDSAGRRILWRLSNSGVVSEIAEGCIASSLTSLGDRIFYETTEGLWFTDGTSTGEQLIYSTQQFTPSFLASDTVTQCEIGLDLYRIINRSRGRSIPPALVKISPDNTVSVAQEFSVADPPADFEFTTLQGRIDICLDDSIVIELDELENNEFFLFRPESASLLNKVVGLTRDFSLFPRGRTSLTSRSVFVSGSFAPYYLTPFNTATLIPSMNMLLEDESSDP